MTLQSQNIIETSIPYISGAYQLDQTMSYGTAQGIAANLVNRYVTEPWRRHHGIQHLSEVMGFLREFDDKLTDPQATFTAGLGHDAIYFARLYTLEQTRDMNERQSADLTQNLIRHHMPDHKVRAVGGHILRTIGHESDGIDTDAAYLLDADLGVLGAHPDRFETYDKAIYEEFRKFIPYEIYKKERARILEGFLKRKRLFFTDVGFERYEAQAKENLEAKIKELTKAKI